MSESKTSGATASPHGTALPVDVTQDRRDRVIWVAFIGGPIVWFAHFMLVYLVAEAGCTGDGHGFDALDHPVPVVVTLGATAVGALVCLGLARWGFQRWRRAVGRDGEVGPSVNGDVADTDGRGSLAFTGMLLSLLSCLAIVFVGLPAPFLNPC